MGAMYTAMVCGSFIAPIFHAWVRFDTKHARYIMDACISHAILLYNEWLCGDAMCEDEKCGVRNRPAEGYS